MASKKQLVAFAYNQQKRGCAGLKRCYGCDSNCWDSCDACPVGELYICSILAWDPDQTKPTKKQESIHLAISQWLCEEAGL